MLACSRSRFEKQEIDDHESHDHQAQAPDQNVAHRRTRFGSTRFSRGLDDVAVVFFRHGRSSLSRRIPAIPVIAEIAEIAEIDNVIYPHNDVLTAVRFPTRNDLVRQPARTAVAADRSGLIDVRNAKKSLNCSDAAG
jgi:hypothetical protein